MLLVPDENGNIMKSIEYFNTVSPESHISRRLPKVLHWVYNMG
jgi:hypothetical protein